MSKEEENERPLALEPCPPLKSYLLRPSGSHVLEAQVSHMSKKFNSSFASKEMSLNASWLRKKWRKSFPFFYWILFMALTQNGTEDGKLGHIERKQN